MKKYIRKADIILFIVLVVVGIAASAWLALSGSAGDTVIIESDGDLYARYKLTDDRTVTVRNGSGTNVVRIHNGEVSVTQANCHNQVCVKHESISSSGESIVCLPNKLMVRIEGSGGNEYDAVSN